MNSEQFDPETGEIIEQQPPTPAIVQPGAADPAPSSAPSSPPVTTPIAPPAPRRTRKKKPARGNGRAPVPVDETPRQRFERIADGRVKAVIKAIRTLKKIGRNQGTYEYSEGDIEFMFERFGAELDELRAAMKPREKEGQIDFSFRR